MLGIFRDFLSSADFFIFDFLEKFFQEYNMSDQARHVVGPDLGSNCLQRLSAEDTSSLRVKCFCGLSHIYITMKYICRK